MTRSQRAGMTLVIAVALTGAAQGQDAAPSVLPRTHGQDPPGRPAYQVIYDHLTGTIELRNHKGQVLRRGVRVCRDAVTRFTTTGFASAFNVIVGGSRPGVLAADLLKASLPQREEASRGAPRGAARLSAADLNDALHRIRVPITSYLSFSGAVVHLAETLPDSLVRVAELGESTPLESLLIRLQRSVDRLESGLSVATQVPIMLEQRHEGAAVAFDELAAIAQTIRAGEVEGGGTSPVATEALAFASRVDSAQRALDTASRRLQLQLRRIELARAPQTFTLGASGDVRRLVIEVHPTTAADMAAIPRVREGSVELYTEPTVSVVCELSVGVGWMPTPHNYVVQGGVVTDLAQNTRVAPSVALSLSSPAFPPVGALLGLGLGSRRRPDFYLGASLRVLHPVLVNGGVVWQYIAHLPPGVQVGQPAASAGFAQSLSFSYTGRWFWGLSYAP